MSYTQFGPRRRQLRVEVLEDRVTPSRLGLLEMDGNVPGGASVVTAPASAGATLLPELAILKEVTDGRDLIRPGDTASFTITVSNPYGAGEAFHVLVTDQLPAADLLAWQVTRSTFDTTAISTGDVLTASSARIPAGATLSVTVSASIPADLFGPLFPVPPTAHLPGGPFELDGNATTGVLGTSGSPTTSHDWDRVFLDVANRTSTSGAIAGSFVTDAVKTTRDDVFTGRSRDTQGIQAGPWRFEDSKPQAGNDIAHAFAATYTDPSNGHVLLFAGLDRYDNSGDATAGFWFFRNPIDENPSVTTNGGHPFTGQHADGDILLVSDFTQGGSVSAIKVFRWTGDDSTGSLVPVTAPDGTTFAIVNGAPITVPWSFTDKSHNSGPAAGEFLEVGVDLTALDVRGCFSNFLAETRSSDSPTATLSDFVIGTFNTCRLELPNTATVQADGIDAISSNRAFITVLNEDTALGASLEQSAPAPVILTNSMTGGILPPWLSGSIGGADLPPRLTDVLAGIMVPARHSPWSHVTSDAASAVTRDEDEPAALRVASEDRAFRIVGEENGLALGKGSDREEDPLKVTDDLWQPG
jgi:uncharacterized repeat protein (TIGR01451 family)